MANGLFNPAFRGAGSPGAPGVGSTQRGLQLVEQGKTTLAQQGLALEQTRAQQPALLQQAALDSVIQTARSVSALPDRQSQLDFLIRNKAAIEERGGDSSHTDDGIRLLQEGAQTGDFGEFDESIGRLVELGQKPVSAKEEAETGKLVAETGKLAAETEDIPRVRSEKELAKKVAAQKTTFGQAETIRKEITKASTDFDKIIGSFDRINAAAKDPSAAGDLALVFNFMKMLDPGSTVREGEFATAAKAAGLGERFIQLATKVDTGEILSPPQRQDFLNQANKIFKASKRRNDRTVESFVKIAARNNIDREDVVVERGESIKGGQKPLFSPVLNREISEQDIADTLQANPGVTREKILQQLGVQ